MRCKDCGSAEAYDGQPGHGLCFACFCGRVDVLTEAIKNASPEGVDHTYLRGMYALGAANEAALDVIAANTGHDDDEPGTMMADYPATLE